MFVSSWQGDPPVLPQSMPQADLQTAGQETSFSETSSPVVHPAICPGLFCPSVALDGYLVRIRLPGGQLTPAQCRVLARVCELVKTCEAMEGVEGTRTCEAAGDAARNLEKNRLQNADHAKTGHSLEVTNRANLQLRGLPGALPSELLAQLQAVQLAAHPAIDHLRNLMASPTAGIDPDQLLDTRPLVAALNAHLCQQLHWSGLSAKFSVGFDGGERVSIQPQPNDLRFTAIQASPGELALHLHLAGVNPAYGNFLLEAGTRSAGSNSADPQTWIEPVIASVTALVQLYLEAVEPGLVRKPRLKQILNALGADLPQRLQRQLSFPLQTAAPLAPKPPSPFHLGVQAQHQPQFSAIGLALPLGQITAQQLRQLADLMESWGLELRLTPWRTLLLSQAPTAQIAQILSQLAALGLDQTHNPIWSNLVACSGSTGCAASATDTQADALALAQVLAAQSTSNRAIPTIHVSGCPKACAHHGSSDLTLVGAQSSTGESGYRLYVGHPASHLDSSGNRGSSSETSTDPPFGQLVTPAEMLLQPAELPQVLTQLLERCPEVEVGSATGLRNQLGQVLAAKPSSPGGA